MLKKLIDIDTSPGKYFSNFISFLIVISLVTFSIETIPELDPVYYLYLGYIEIAIVLIFTFEYLLRLALLEKRLKFIFSFYGLIDLVAILPFYLSTSLDLRTLRIFRLLRLFRAFKLLRYTNAINTIRNAVYEIKEELIIFLIASIFLLYVSATGIYYFENEAQPEAFKSIFHSLWWAVATLTTVGYGDVYPITVGGKIFTTIIVFIGLGVVAVPTGLFASSLTNILNRKKM